MRVVVTGFHPGEAHPYNTSWEVKNALHDKVGNVEIIKEEMIASYAHSIEYIDKMVEKYHPDAFICMGQALRREVISLEKVAINYANETRDWAVDDDGYVPKGVPIVPGGPDGLFTNLPIEKMLKAMEDNKGEVQGEISLTAGSIGCNNAMYSVLYLIKTKYPNMMGGFIHVPGDHDHPRRVRKTFSVPAIVEGVEAALKALGE